MPMNPSLNPAHLDGTTGNPSLGSASCVAPPQYDILSAGPAGLAQQERCV